MDEFQFVHVRRCHLCDFVNERNETLVDRCDRCGKCLAPYYFFDEKSVQVYSDVKQRPSEETSRARPKDQLGDHRPLRGLSTVW